jgi:hypothetical protein
VPKSYVLKALKLLSLDEILKLATAVKVKSGLLKKAAGQELVSWEESSDPHEVMTEKNSPPQKSDFKAPADILPFKRPEKKEESLSEDCEGAKEHASLVSSEFILWHRELNKDAAVGPSQTKEAIKGYMKSTEMYVVKTPSSDGKDKIRFASTQGVLINKKQA